MARISWLGCKFGHVTPQMTPRSATLASPTLRAACDEAMGTMRRQFTLTPVGKPILRDKVGWLRSEMLKTTFAHGYCARHPAPVPCPYANIFQTCDNYVTAPEFRDALADELADIKALKTDADSRGWTDEVARRERVAHALTGHLRRRYRCRRTSHLGTSKRVNPAPSRANGQGSSRRADRAGQARIEGLRRNEDGRAG